MITFADFTVVEPDLKIKFFSESARMDLNFLIPRTKQIASKMFDFPDPFAPVIQLKCLFKSSMTTFCAYDLNPS